MSTDHPSLLQDYKEWDARGPLFIFSFSIILCSFFHFSYFCYFAGIELSEKNQFQYYYKETGILLL